MTVSELSKKQNGGAEKKPQKVRLVDNRKKKDKENEEDFPPVQSGHVWDHFRP